MIARLILPQLRLRSLAAHDWPLTTSIIVLGAAAAIALLDDAALHHPPDLVAVGVPMSGPSLDFPMGTDDLGRDILSRVMAGVRMSVVVGGSAAALCVLIGVVVGTISGFLGGAIDQFLMRGTEAFQVVPQFFLAAVLAALWGPRMVTLIVVIGLLGWPVVAKLVRTEFIVLRSRQYVSAARVQGRSALSIAAFEILPNAMGPIIVAGTILVGDAILLEAGLSYLGLGDLSKVSLGLMLYQSQSILQIAWWATVFPGATLTLIVVSLNIVGDALNERLDPRIHRNTPRARGY